MEMHENKYTFRCSSVVEQCAVNALVAGSNPAAGAAKENDLVRGRFLYCGSVRSNVPAHIASGFEDPADVLLCKTAGVYRPCNGRILPPREPQENDLARDGFLCLYGSKVC